MLAPAALAVAVCVGLGISAFESDLSGREFGWRQLLSVAALVFVGLGLLPVVAGAVNGRWGLPAQGAEQPLAFLGRPSTTGVSRVLWLGDPRALPGRRLDGAPRPGLRAHPRGSARRNPGLHPGRPGPGQPGRQRGRARRVGRHRAPRAPPGLGRGALRRGGRRTLGLGTEHGPTLGQRTAARRPRAGSPRAGRPAGGAGRPRGAGLRQR